jgi:quaternary ammonium compound-resistance protein SugE
MAWLLLISAGLLETGFAISLKLSHGLTRVGPTVLFAIFALASFGLLTIALKHLEVGTAYAVWTGIGTAGAVVIGMVWLGETATVLKLVSITLVLAGVTGLQISGGAH